MSASVRLVERERTTNFGDLILPLYYIASPQLEDSFQKIADRLARIVSEHNYKDIRKYRHHDLDTYEVRQMVTDLATELVNRLKGLARKHLSSETIAAHVTMPTNYSRTPRRCVVIGTLSGVPDGVEIWMVVQTGNVYHPQARLHASQTTWQSAVILGRSENGADTNREFTVHVLAVTESVSAAFWLYLTDPGMQPTWSGVPRPQESRVLATIVIIRDDSVSALRFLEGVYNEFRSDGTATGGVIRIKPRSSDSITTEAVNSRGQTEWTGHIVVSTSANPLRGDGRYSYDGKPDAGEHRLTFDPATGDLKVEGKNTASGGEPFKMLWKRS